MNVFFLNVYWEQITDDVTARILSCVVTALFALTAILGNGIVMLVIWKTQELHSPSFTLLFCLAASDLLVGIIAQPCFVAYNVAKILDHFSAYCKLRMIQFFCGWITSGVSLLTLSGVCIDRLLALTLHLRYSSLISVTGGNGYSRSLGHLFCWDHHKVLVRQMGHSSRNRSSVDPSNDCVLHK